MVASVTTSDSLCVPALPRTPKRVVVLGGGPAGLFCADRLRHHFEVTVVDLKEYFEYTPSILRAVVDPAHLSRITFDYREVLERQLGIEFIRGEASSIETSLPGGRGSVLVTPPTGSSGLAASRINFDYLVASVGVGNGLWKPRSPGEPPGPGAAPSAGSLSTDERTIEVRRAELRSLRERIAGAQGAVVVGAGLVGVEMAAELTHFFPRLEVTLVDGAPTVLPQLAEDARDYAHQWLQKHGVKLQLGRPFVPDSYGPDTVIFWCVGTRPRSAGLFDDMSVVKKNGMVRVNRRMQVLRRVGNADGASINDPEEKNPQAELEPLGQGRVFAVGDAAAVEGVPTVQMIFHGEEMAAVAVANIEAAEDIASPLSFGKGRREAEPGQPLLCCTSLGPTDGMFSTQSELVATGVFAAVQKSLIEETKMGALQGDMLSSLLWLPVH